MNWTQLFPTERNRPTRPDMFVDSSPLSDDIEMTYRDNPQSFGYDFNLIRAVAEYGPTRIDMIEKRLTELQTEMLDLQNERKTLEALVAVVKPAP